MSKVQIEEQANRAVQRLIDQLERAAETRVAAGEAWQAANNAPSGVDGQKTLEAAGQLDKAIEGYYQATHDLAQHVRSLFQTGYRLSLPEDS